MKQRLAELAKTIVAITGVLTEIVNLGLVPTGDQKAVSVTISLLTTIGVYLVPNRKPVQ